MLGPGSALDRLRRAARARRAPAPTPPAAASAGPPGGRDDRSSAHSRAVKPPGLESVVDDPAMVAWFHSIDLGDGVVTSGLKSSERLALEANGLNLPDLTGKSVLDIGAWDGYFSFEAERRGAARVVALDHYAWSVDQAEQRRLSQAAWDRGERLRPWHEIPELWRPDELPGRAGFDLARRRLGSKVEAVVGDFMTMDLSTLGTFDVVLFLGVLYHLQEPLAALRRLFQVTGRVAIVETVSVVVPGLGNHQMWEFFETDELDHDPGNWWAGTPSALRGLARAAGFSPVHLKGHPAEDDPPLPGQDLHYGRAVFHAFPDG